MNTSFRPIHQSSLRQSRTSSRVISSHRGPSRLASASFGHDLTIDAGEPTRDGVVELTKNAKYCVSRLPATPVVLKGNDEISTGGSDQGTSHALVVSEDKTFVWDYMSPDHVPNTINFPLPDASYSPFSVLVSPAPGSKEPGLVTIDIEGGNVTYWEAVGGAVADGLLHRRKSITEKCGLYSGEWVDNFQNLEPAGIVATTSSGRYILITLRDSNGKPQITSRTMRGSGTGLMSVLKGTMLPQGHRRGVVSIKPGAVTGRSERRASIINDNGDLSVWECSRSGYARLTMEHRFKGLMVDSIVSLYPHAEKTLKVHDVEVSEEHSRLFILASFEHSDHDVYYILFTIVSEDDDYRIISSHRLQSYTQKSTRPPKLQFPAPYKTLFAVFSHGVVLIEAVPEKQPDNTPSRRWEDVITFRSDVLIAGCGKEDVATVNGKLTRNCGIVLLAQRGGVIRIERFEDAQIPVQQKQLALEPELAKSKVEQAVFYGYDAKGGFNPVNFDQQAAKFDHQILEDAVLQVSNEILTTTSLYMPPILPSLSEHLEMRVACLQRLARYMHENYPENQLSVKARLQLLWDLQRTEVARGLWEFLDRQLNESSEQGREMKSILVTAIRKNGDDEGDSLREWFLLKANAIEKLLVDVGKLCVQAKDISILLETNEILLQSIYMAALNTLDKYCPVYGLDSTSSCEQAPWLASPEMIQLFENQYNATRNGYQAVEKSTMESPKLAHCLLFLVETLCAMYRMRLEWMSTSVAAANGEAQRLSITYHEKRGQWIRQLVAAGKKEDALKIADTFGIHRSVIEILVEDWNLSVSQKDPMADEYLRQLGIYLEKGGYEFAAVLYQYFVETKQLKSLLTLFPDYNQYLDKFFENKRNGRISWVNDVTNHRYSEAAQTLVSSNSDNSDLSSNNKLRLSIAKLCLLTDIKSNRNARNMQLNEINSQLQVANAQDALTYQISADSEGLAHLANRPALMKVTERVLTRMNEHRSITPEELVDGLTLIQVDSQEGRLNFYRALEIVYTSAMSSERKQLNELLIWRRLLLADDWAKIVNTKSKSDAKVQAVTEKTILYQTLTRAIENKIMSEKSIDFVMDPASITKVIQNLSQRYAYATESQLQGIMKDIETENQSVLELIQKYSLDSWTKGIYTRVESVAEGSSKLSNTPQLKMDLS